METLHWQHSAGDILSRRLVLVQGSGVSGQSGGRSFHCLACGQDTAVPGGDSGSLVLRCDLVHVWQPFTFEHHAAVSEKCFLEDVKALWGADRGKISNQVCMNIFLW